MCNRPIQSTEIMHTDSPGNIGAHELPSKGPSNCILTSLSPISPYFPSHW